MPLVYLSLGSNMGDRDNNLRLAREKLEGPELHIRKSSGVYETVPVGETEFPVPSYLNCVVQAETSLPPHALLDYTQAVERECGRVPTFRWGPRTIDIDIVWYEGVEMESARLTIPHPRIKERAFVLTPLMELVPDLALPGGVKINKLLKSEPLRSQSVSRLTTKI
jgi:2-amino-4-hydroxy-6-hydroxymethyldihydropteridine diphosphokinase